MDISFLNSNLKKLCEDQKYANRKLGSTSSKKLRTRLRNLKVAVKLGEIPVGHPHPLKGDRTGQFALKGDRTGQFALNLAEGRRLVFEPFDDPIPLNPDGSVEWREVRSIRIVFIGDYHG